MRRAYLLIGWTGIGLGTLGIFLPLLPTTVFVILAAWAFAKADPRWHAWLVNHPRFGPLLDCWQRHRALPRRAKLAALVALALSYAITAWAFGPTSWAAILGGVCIAGVAVYIAHLPLLTHEQEARLRRP
jgi:uncharacterized membrane protein YbaN (DUF454 family)